MVAASSSPLRVGTTKAHAPSRLQAERDKGSQSPWATQHSLSATHGLTLWTAIHHRGWGHRGADMAEVKSKKQGAEGLLALDQMARFTKDNSRAGDQSPGEEFQREARALLLGTPGQVGGGGGGAG